MSFERRLRNAGILKPADVSMLRRLLETTLPVGASAKEREAHATTLVTLFRSGVTREGELLETFAGASER